MLWLSDTLFLLRRNSTSDAFKPRAPRGLLLTFGKTLVRVWEALDVSAMK